ncbi:MAG: AEC family transporter [Cyanobacteria bacterium P01_F01_bin.150]
MAILISAVLPIALVAMVGVIIGRRFELELKTLSRISIYGLLPALVLTGLVEMTLEVGNAIALVTAFYLNTLVLYLLALVLGKLLNLREDTRKSLLASTIFANVGNMGLPFVFFALGDEGLERAIVYLVASSLMIATFFPIVIKGEGLKAGLKVTLSLPVFWAAVAGMAIQIFGGELPASIGRGATLMADGAIPIALLTLGVQLSRTQFIFGRYEAFAAGLRLIVSPMLAHTIGRLVGVEGLELQVLTLQAAMPVAVNSLIWVTEFGGDTVRLARTIVLSTLLSLATLPIVLALTS